MSGSLAVVPGSIAAIAKSEGVSLAEAFLGAKVIALVDVSGSMDVHDSRGGRTRYEVALEELRKVQAGHPGQVAVIAFSTTVQYCPGGEPPLIARGTDLAQALQFAKVADVAGVRFVVISDGCPDDERAALRVAAQYSAHIDTVFVGPEGDWSGGREFLTRLAAANGGTAVVADRVMQLADKLEVLMLAA